MYRLLTQTDRRCFVICKYIYKRFVWKSLHIHNIYIVAASYVIGVLSLNRRTAINIREFLLLLCFHLVRCKIIYGTGIFFFCIVAAVIEEDPSQSYFCARIINNACALQRQDDENRGQRLCLMLILLSILFIHVPCVMCSHCFITKMFIIRQFLKGSHEYHLYPISMPTPS